MIICEKNYEEIVGFIKDRTPDFDEKTATIFVLCTMLDKTDSGLYMEFIKCYYATPDNKWMCFIRTKDSVVRELGIVGAEIEFARIASIIDVPTHIYTKNKVTPKTLTVYITEKVHYRDKRIDDESNESFLQ